MYRIRVPVPRQESRALDTEKVDVVAARDAKTERPKGDGVGLRDPQALVVELFAAFEGVAKDLWDEDFAQCLLGLLALVRCVGIVHVFRRFLVERCFFSLVLGRKGVQRRCRKPMHSG